MPGDLGLLLTASPRKCLAEPFDGLDSPVPPAPQDLEGQGLELQALSLAGLTVLIPLLIVSVLKGIARLLRSPVHQL